MAELVSVLFQTCQVPANSAPNTKGNLLPHLHWNPTVRLFLRFRSNRPFNQIRQKKWTYETKGCTVIDLVDNLKRIKLSILFVDERLTQKPPLTPPSADVVSLLPAQSGVHKQNQSVSVPRRQEFLAFNLAVLENILSFLTDLLACLMYLLLYRFYVKRSHSKSPDPFLLLLIQVNVTINDFYSSEQYFPLRFFMGIFNPSQESLTAKRATMTTTIMKMLSFRRLSQVQLNAKLQHVQQRSFICLYEPLISAKLYS